LTAKLSNQSGKECIVQLLFSIFDLELLWSFGNLAILVKKYKCKGLPKENFSLFFNVFLACSMYFDILRPVENQSFKLFLPFF
jgi:hypothetical protein